MHFGYDFGSFLASLALHELDWTGGQFLGFQIRIGIEDWGLRIVCQPSDGTVSIWNDQDNKDERARRTGGQDDRRKT